MSTAVAAPSKIGNLAELLERLGGISPERIRLHPPPGTATVEDVVRVQERENRLCELVDGVLVEKAMGLRESLIAALIVQELGAFVKLNGLGVVSAPDGMFRLPGNLVRMPDAAFAAWDRVPDEEAFDEGAPEIVPDLAVEVLSPGNTAAEMDRKLREYFRAGVRLVWLVDPKSKSVTVYTSLMRPKVVPASGTLDGGKVLPGFSLPVANLFPNLKLGRKKPS